MSDEPKKLLEDHEVVVVDAHENVALRVVQRARLLYGIREDGRVLVVKDELSPPRDPIICAGDAYSRVVALAGAQSTAAIALREHITDMFYAGWKAMAKVVQAEHRSEFPACNTVLDSPYLYDRQFRDACHKHIQEDWACIPDMLGFVRGTAAALLADARGEFTLLVKLMSALQDDPSEMLFDKLMPAELVKLSLMSIKAAPPAAADLREQPSRNLGGGGA